MIKHSEMVITNYMCLLSVCPKGTAGIDCLDKCPNCDNGGLCDYKTARCICLPGFRGDYCQAGKLYKK